MIALSSSRVCSSSPLLPRSRRFFFLKKKRYYTRLLRRDVKVVQSRLFLRFVHTHKRKDLFWFFFFCGCVTFLWAKFFHTKSRQKKRKKETKKRGGGGGLISGFCLKKRSFINLSFRPFFSSFLKHSSTLNIAWVGLRSLIKRTFALFYGEYSRRSRRRIVSLSLSRSFLSPVWAVSFLSLFLSVERSQRKMRLVWGACNRTRTRKTRIN